MESTQFIELEASGWKGRAGTAIGCREDDRRFFGEVFAEAFRRERLIVTGLDLAGKPLARHVHAGRRAKAASRFKLAYDEAHEKSSPGMLGGGRQRAPVHGEPGAALDRFEYRPREHGLRPRVEGLPHGAARGGWRAAALGALP